jgi:periplasmic protein CpxP/Spy
MKIFNDCRRLVRRAAIPLMLSAATIAPFANAQTSGVSPGHRGGGHGLTDKTMQAIDATADQRAKILSIQSQARADIRAQRQASGNARLQMAQALAAPTVDAAAAEAARQKMLAQADAAGQRMLQAKLMIAAVLTPDQRQRLLDLEQRRHGRAANPTS